jgi:hypothetical protein
MPLDSIRAAVGSKRSICTHNALQASFAKPLFRNTVLLHYFRLFQLSDWYFTGARFTEGLVEPLSARVSFAASAHNEDEIDRGDGLKNQVGIWSLDTIHQPPK